MSALDNHFYSSVNFSLGSATVKSKTSKQNSKSSFLELTEPVQFASLVKNYTTGLQEILIQDSDLMVYLISLNGGIIWKRQIDSQIQGSLEQLDFFKNSKLQYFFSTMSKLYVIDRLGRDVAGFPKSLPSTPKFSGLVDYDKSKNYRFLISSVTNEVYLFDKEGNKLSNWDPKKFETEIAYSPEHMKVGGKDYFVVFLTDGTVHIFNRKGDRIDFFQTKDKNIFGGDYYLESGMSSSTTYLYYISNEGTVSKQNLKGEILASENLLRGKNSKFILKRARTGGKFYSFRIDVDKIAVFNKEGAIVFEKQNSGSTNVEFQCIETGRNKMLFSFFDVEQRLVQVFDESGNSLIQTPIESDIPPLFGLGKSKSEFGIYSFPRNSVIFNLIR
jgi:DNA-binding beta-propeller fold protein YncE